jgi:phosphoglycolate phosphatase
MKLIIFDFDGVLVDTLDVNFSINKSADPSITLEKYIAHFEGNIYDAVKLGKKKAIPDFFKHYNLKTRRLTVPEEIKNVLKNLSHNFQLAIVSSTPSASIKTILSREGADTYFKDILGQETHTSKVVKIKMLLQKYNVDPMDAVYVTDTTGDVREARECDVRSVAVTWGFHTKETLQKVNPAFIVDNPEELMSAIEMC